MRFSRTLSALAVLLVASAVTTPGELEAQACLADCVQASCGGGWHGVGGTGQEKETCSMGDGCTVCKGEEQQEEFAAIDAAVFGLEQASTEEDLSRIVVSLGDRLLVNPAQNLVVVLAGCVKKAPSYLTRVTRGQVETLLGLGVPTYGQFLSDQAASMTVAEGGS